MTSAFKEYLRQWLSEAVKNNRFRGPNWPITPITFEDCEKEQDPIIRLLGTHGGGEEPITLDIWLKEVVSQLLDVSKLFEEVWDQKTQTLKGIRSKLVFLRFLVENPLGEPEHPLQNKTVKNAEALFRANKEIVKLRKSPQFLKPKRSLVRDLVLQVMIGQLAQGRDYRRVLRALDSADDELQYDSLFKKWHKEYGILCWSDIVEHDKACKNFQSWLSKVKNEAGL